jgi:hypothetical protein
MVLFLDFDGVLNSGTSRQKTHCTFHLDLFENRPLRRDRIDFDDNCVRVLIAIINFLNVKKIVVTSTWRVGVDPKYFKQLFDLYGISGIEFDTLPTGEYADESSKGMGSRGDMVEDYIRRKGVTDYICIDDMSTHYYRFSMDESKYVFITDKNLGLIDQDYMRIVTAFSK